MSDETSEVSARFIEVSMACSDAALQEAFWVEMFDAKVIFRGRMEGQRFSRIVVAGVSLVFREDPAFEAPPGPGRERSFRAHLGLRVPHLDEAIRALEARGARFVLKPDEVRRLQRSKGADDNPLLEIDYIASPLTAPRIAAGDFRHDVAIFVGPDNLWVELNEIREPTDTGWYPGSAPADSS
jgi:catechol 2,3-dioxygenase-like lactoylglutathione lyase family enzyme